MAPTNTSKIPLGTVLVGKYRLSREIGRGGMAAVYEAENVDIGKRVAIKVLAAELTASTIVVERFLREARAAAAISSPYICDVYDSGKLEDGRPFLVLELLEGESLYERMTRVRQIDVPSTVRMVGQVARGLTKAHAAGIVHRDLKPENIFLTKDEEGAAPRQDPRFRARQVLHAARRRRTAGAADARGRGLRNARVHEPRAGEGARAGRSPRRSLGARLHGVRVPDRAHGVVDRAGRGDDVRADRERAAAERADLPPRSAAELPDLVRKGAGAIVPTTGFKPPKSSPKSSSTRCPTTPPA